MRFSIPKLPNLGIEIKLEGQWQSLEQLPTKIAKSMATGYEKATDQFANRLIKVVKRSIASGTPPPGGGVYWQPLSNKYQKKVGEHLPYYLTGLYYRSVKLRKSKTRFFVGVGSEKASGGGSRIRKGRSKLSIAAVARILEYGTLDGSIPARPLWAPAIKSIGGKAKLKQMIILEVRRSLSSKGIQANQVRYG